MWREAPRVELQCLDVRRNARVKEGDQPLLVQRFVQVAQHLGLHGHLVARRSLGSLPCTPLSLAQRITLGKDVVSQLAPCFCGIHVARPLQLLQALDQQCVVVVFHLGQALQSRIARIGARLGKVLFTGDLHRV